MEGFGVAKRGNTMIWLLVAFFLISLICAGAFLVYYLTHDKQSSTPKEVVTPTKKIHFDIFNEWGLLEGANMSVVEFSTGELVRSAITFNTSLLVFNLPVNHTYKLYFDGMNYYPETTVLTIGTTEDSTFNTTVYLYPSDLNLAVGHPSEEVYSLSLNTANRLNEPVLCVLWSANVVSVTMDRPVADPPSRLRFFDKCFQLPTLDNGRRVESVRVKGSSFDGDSLSFVLVDKAEQFDMARPSAGEKVVMERPDGFDVGYHDFNLTVRLPFSG